MNLVASGYRELATTAQASSSFALDIERAGDSRLRAASSFSLGSPFPDEVSIELLNLEIRRMLIFLLVSSIDMILFSSRKPSSRYGSSSEELGFETDLNTPRMSKFSFGSDVEVLLVLMLIYFLVMFCRF